MEDSFKLADFLSGRPSEVIATGSEDAPSLIVGILDIIAGYLSESNGDWDCDITELEIEDEVMDTYPQVTSITIELMYGAMARIHVMAPDLEISLDTKFE